MIFLPSIYAHAGTDNIMSAEDELGAFLATLGLSVFAAKLRESGVQTVSGLGNVGSAELVEMGIDSLKVCATP